MSSVYLEQTGIHATLTTWIYTSFWMLYAAEKTGHTGYIHWPRYPNKALVAYFDDERFARQPNMFDWYFQQPHHAAPPPMDDVWNWEQGRPEIGTHSLAAQPLATIREFYHKHLRFTPEVEARGQALAAKYGIDFSNTIGVTWRGTDIYIDGRPYLPIELYFPFIDKCLREKPNARIACTAEEEGVLDPLMARYPQAFKVTEFLQAPKGHKHNPERFTKVSGFERGLQPALMVWLFSKCAYYVKNRSSTGAVASWISDGIIYSLAHDETLNYDKPPILHPDTGEVLWKP